jgi:hypothetical protein
MLGWLLQTSGAWPFARDEGGVMANEASWVTVEELLERTGLPYGDLMILVDRGLIGSQTSGAVTVYDAHDVSLIARAAGRSR